MNLSVKRKLVLFGPLSSGHIQKWTKGVKEYYDITYITYHDGNVEGKKIIIPSLFGTKLDYILFFPMVAFNIYKIKPDLVHAHYFSSYGVILSFIPFIKNKVLSVWGSDVNDLNTNGVIRESLYKFALSQFKYINSSAKHLTDKMLKLNEALPIETYQYGISNVPNKPREPLQNKTLEFYSPRNFDSLYQIERLITAFQRSLKLFNMDAKLYIYGKGTLEQEQLIQRLCVSDCVQYIGFLPYESLIERIRKHDVICSIPVKDGTPLSLFEGVANGSFPLLSDIVANRNWFKDSDAIYFSESEGQQLEDKIFQVYSLISNNSSEYRKAILRNWQVAYDECNYDKNIKNLLSAYKNVVS